MRGSRVARGTLAAMVVLLAGGPAPVAARGILDVHFGSSRLRDVVFELGSPDRVFLDGQEEGVRDVHQDLVLRYDSLGVDPAGGIRGTVHFLIAEGDERVRRIVVTFGDVVPGMPRPCVIDVNEAFGPPSRVVRLRLEDDPEALVLDLVPCDHPEGIVEIHVHQDIGMEAWVARGETSVDRMEWSADVDDRARLPPCDDAPPPSRRPERP